MVIVSDKMYPICPLCELQLEQNERSNLNIKCLLSLNTLVLLNEQREHTFSSSNLKSHSLTLLLVRTTTTTKQSHQHRRFDVLQEETTNEPHQSITSLNNRSVQW
jgi:hypothetical protein